MQASTNPEKQSGTAAAVMALYLILIFILSLGLIIAVWPNPQGDPHWFSTMSAEIRYLLLVVCGGALGGSLHAIRSLIWVLGHRQSLKGWVLWYALRALVGIPLALIFYMAVRGGLLSPGADSRLLNPYGMLAFSVGIGFSGMSILEKLTAVFSAPLKSDVMLETEIERIGAALGLATLDNYQGFVCLAFQDKEGKSLSLTSDEHPVLPSRAPCELSVWFQPDKPEGVLANELQLTGGTDTKNLAFKLVADSDSVSLRPRQHESVSFLVKESSPRVKFQFQAPETSAPYEIWIEVFQKNRLVHVMSTTFYVSNKGN